MGWICIVRDDSQRRALWPMCFADRIGSKKPQLEWISLGTIHDSHMALVADRYRRKTKKEPRGPEITRQAELACC